MRLVFCFIGGCPGFSCTFISVSLIVRSVLNNFSNFSTLLIISSFSDWSVVFVVLSIFVSSELNSRSQSISTDAFSFGKIIIKFLLIPLYSASTVIFPTNFISILKTSRYLLVIGTILPSFNIYVSGGIIETCDRVCTINYFSVPSNLSVKVKWFLRSVRCFNPVITFIDLSVSPPSVFSGSVISLVFRCLRCSNTQTFAKCPFF